MENLKNYNERIKQKRSDEIKKVAIRLFIKNGYDNVSVDDICKKVKCSHGLFYHYFISLEDLLKDIINDANELISRDVLKLIATKHEGIYFFDEFSKYVLNSIKVINARTYYIFLFFALFNSKKLSKIKTMTDKTLSLLVNQIKLGQERNEILEGEPTQIAIAYFCLIEGIVYRRRFFNEQSITAIPSNEIIVNLLTKKNTGGK